MSLQVVTLRAVAWLAIGILAACGAANRRAWAADAAPSAKFAEKRSVAPSPADQFTVRKMLRQSQLDGALFDRVYRWRLEQFTWRENIATLPELRQRLKTDFRIAARAEAAAHQRLCRLVLAEMSAMAADARYHPATRVNAMLVLGDLNSREALSTNDVAVPLPDTLPELLKAVERVGPTAEGADHAVASVALVGLLRHAKSGIADNDARRDLVKQMHLVAAESEVPDGRHPAAHTWIRRRAVDVLEAAIRPGGGSADAAAAGLLRNLVVDRQVDLALRIDAAEALASLAMSKNPTKEQPSDAVAQGLGFLAVDVVRSEVSGSRQLGWSPAHASSQEAMKQGLQAAWRALRPGDADENPLATVEPAASGDFTSELAEKLRELRRLVWQVYYLDRQQATLVAMYADELEAWLEAAKVPKDALTAVVPPS